MLHQLIDRLSPRLQSLDRKFISYQYLHGMGIEVGALHAPLEVNPRKAQVRYVDRMTQEDLLRQYPELDGKPLVHVDYVADGELLESVPDTSQDFMIANHFIEHCQNTILTLHNFLRVLKPGGVIFLGVPDKRFTFDKLRPSTTIEHLLRDYEEGPQVSRTQHFVEWVDALHPNGDADEKKAECQRLLDIDYSIHFHVWTKTDMDELLLYLIRKMQFPFEVELSLRRRNTNENIYILRKHANPGERH